MQEFPQLILAVNAAPTTEKIDEKIMALFTYVSTCSHPIFIS